MLNNSDIKSIKTKMSLTVHVCNHEKVVQGTFENLPTACSGDSLNSDKFKKDNGNKISMTKTL